MTGTTLRGPRRRLMSTVLATAMLLTFGWAAPTTASDLAEVIPELVPKAELPLAPDGEVNVSVAPAVPPPSDRSSPAIVEVDFEIVEQVTAIDPARAVEPPTRPSRPA